MTEPNPRSTVLSPQRYLDLIGSDGARLASVAQGHLDDLVPPCPGWTVTDLVTHTGEVYHHKVACTLLGRRPTDEEYEHGPADGQDLLEWFRSAHATLLETLGNRSADTHSFTWYDPDQTVGFWLRRMAQESVVHRVDAESASDQVTAAADDLAVDGIDEVLHLFLSYAIGEDPEEELDGYVGASLLVRTGPWAWHVVVDPADPANRIPLTRSARPAKATVSGEPSELLLWLWGRRPDSAVTIQGDAAALASIRTQLKRGTE